MEKQYKAIIDGKVKFMVKYDTKVGANDLAYKMVTDELKAITSNEVEATECIDYLVQELKNVGLWKISRVTFNTKELYKDELLKLHNRLVKEGVLVKDKLSTNRFYLVNDDTNQYYNVSANISKSTTPQEITRYEMVTNTKGSKKKVLESIK